MTAAKLFTRPLVNPATLMMQLHIETCLKAGAFITVDKWGDYCTVLCTTREDIRRKMTPLRTTAMEQQPWNNENQCRGKTDRQCQQCH